MVALAAQVACFHYEAALQLTLQVSIPLLDDRVGIVVEEAVADAQAQIGVAATGGSIDAPARQIVTVRERIAERSPDGLKPVGSHDHVGSGLETLGTAAAR